MKKPKPRLLPLLLAGAALLLLVLYFTAVRPLTRAPEVTAPPVTTSPGEGALYQKGTLYPPIRREEMVSITVHNSTGTYRFARTAKEGEAVDKTSNFVIFQKKEGEFKSYGHIVYDNERFSELVVASGTFYYYKNLGEDPALAGTPLDFADYGLSEADDPAWFEISTFGGESVRVYIGDKAVTDSGYYVRVEGRNTVYVSNTTLVGETALASLASFVDPTLTTPFVQNAYYYNRNFTLWRPSEAGHAIGEGDVVEFTFREKEGGVYGTLQEGSAELRTALDAFRTAFLGKRVGDAPFELSITYPDDHADEELRGKTVEYRIESVDAVKALYITLDYLNDSERNGFHSGVSYKITAPSEKTGYLPSSNHYMSILEKIGMLSGTEVVAVGLDEGTMEEYGLSAYTIYYETPKDVAFKSNSKDIVVKQYVPNYLYISEKQEDGSYFVGSLLTDVVARVEGDVLAFLDKPDTFWLNENLYIVNITNVSQLSFSFSYTDARETYTFDLTRKAGEDGRYSVTGVEYREGDRAVTVDHFKAFYMHLVTIYYSGEYDGALPKEEVLSSGEILRMRVTMADGEVYEYRFCPYSGRHVLASIAKEGESEGAYFYVLASEVEKMYRDIAAVIGGQAPDPDRQY